MVVGLILVTENGLTGISGTIAVGITFMTRAGALSGLSASIAYPNRSKDGPPDAIAFDLRRFEAGDDIGAGNGPLSAAGVNGCFSSCATACAIIRSCQLRGQAAQKTNFRDVLPKKGPNVLLDLAFGPLLFLSSRGVEVHRN
jgi:hypothetical protein